MAKAKAKKSEKTPFKQRMRNAFIETVQTGFGSTHLLVSMYKNRLERQEANFIKFMDSVDPEETIKYRRQTSIARELIYKQRIDSLKEKIASFTITSKEVLDDVVLNADA